MAESIASVRHTAVDVTDARWPDLVRWQFAGATRHLALQFPHRSLRQKQAISLLPGNSLTKGVLETHLSLYELKLPNRD